MVHVRRASAEEELISVSLGSILALRIHTLPAIEIQVCFVCCLP